MIGRKNVKNVGIILTVISLVVLVLYINENNKKETITEFKTTNNDIKLLTIPDVLKDSDFNIKETALRIDFIYQELNEPFPFINVEDEKQKNQIINQLKELKLQEIKPELLLPDYRITIILNKEYNIFVTKENSRIYFTTEGEYYYRAINSDELFKTLENLMK